MDRQRDRQTLLGHRHEYRLQLPAALRSQAQKRKGIEDTKVIKAWQKDLTKRAEKARAAGRHLHIKFYHALYRPT